MKPIDLAIRLEWVAVVLAALVFYAGSNGSWWLFAALILVPDLSMLGYLAGPRVGAIAYNGLHYLVFPAALLVGGFALASALAMRVALIWVAHIAVDRALGYGLKFSTGFQDTHLGRIGRKVSP